MRIAVVGSGAAAVGVLAGLRHWGRGALDTTVFEVGERIADAPATPPDRGLPDRDLPDRGLPDRGLTDPQLRAIYEELHATHGYAFPPPKSHFGKSIPKLDVDDAPLLWHSPHRGGLTTFWGGAMLPFTDRELRGWPITAADLAPHYRLIADEVGVCGERDELNRYFEDDHVNRPPLRTSRVMDRLQRAINQRGDGATYRLLAGTSRLSLETRSDHPNACVYSGECMIGCPRRSIWSASHSLERLEAQGFPHRYVAGRVLAVDRSHVVYRDHRGHAGPERAGPFDRIYIAAGCLGSTEIVMRSLAIPSGPVMQDNAALWFPLLYTGRDADAPGPFFSLSNVSVLGVPRGDDEPVIKGGFYPTVDHIWRYYTPPSLWPWVHRASGLLRWRLLIGRVYLGDAANRRFRLALRDDALAIHAHAEPDVTPALGSLMRDLRRALGEGSFHVPVLRPRRHGTSVHYSSTIPYGGSLIDLPRHGRIAPGVYLADASTFPTGPAIPPTFTIMANASRTVYESLDD